MCGGHLDPPEVTGSIGFALSLLKRKFLPNNMNFFQYHSPRRTLR
ncbi:hypothetical protein BURPS1710A_3477 [Burkholderia pseudomallei 1710a]|uniref:Uncharacterized protein n=1 Tax=Burkholderia pseudomallei 1710a TaxID=320371 RepID=A0A0E1W4P1_BURPE|nr:hypothetical protein BURPS1710A_3477 [Burkholderia pseudomallei 1710a]